MTTPMPAELQTERRDSALVLTISDPESNNWVSEQVFTAGVEAIDVAESDPAIRCIVLQGEGANFCAATTLPLWKESGVIGNDLRRHFKVFADALRFSSKPVIAAVEGTACGDGFWLAMACDLIVAASDAKFLPFPTTMQLDPEETLRLPRGQLLEWMWLNEPVPAQRLHAIGLVNRLSEPRHALRESLACAKQLSHCDPAELTRAKEVVNAHLQQQQALSAKP